MAEFDELLNIIHEKEGNMATIDDYRIVRADSASDLEFLVREWVGKDSFQPLGPPIITVANNKREYVQTLVSYTRTMSLY